MYRHYRGVINTIINLFVVEMKSSISTFQEIFTSTGKIFILGGGLSIRQ